MSDLREIIISRFDNKSYRKAYDDENLIWKVTLLTLFGGQDKSCHTIENLEDVSTYTKG